MSELSNQFSSSIAELGALRIPGLLKCLDDFCTRVPVVEKHILELGSDYAFFIARTLRERGARHVHATNLEPRWRFAQDYVDEVLEPGISAGVLDARDMKSKFNSESVDAVFATAFAEHIHDPAQVVEEIADILVPGGYCYIHGNPIWSGPTGHHLYVQGISRFYSFTDADIVIPDWHHLIWDRDSLSEHLHSQRIPEEDILRITDRIFDSSDVNRLGFRDLKHHFCGGPLDCIDIIPSALRKLPPNLLEKIESGPWGGQEDYTCNGVAFLLRKPLR